MIKSILYANLQLHVAGQRFSTPKRNCYLFAQFYIFIPFLTNHWSEINVNMADDPSTLLKLKQLQVD